MYSLINIKKIILQIFFGALCYGKEICNLRAYKIQDHNLRPEGK